MAILVAAALVLVFTLVPATCRAGNGDPVDGHPTYRERALLALTNACRQGPTQYRDAWLGTSRILNPRIYPPVPPLYGSLPLARSARAHSRDMARHGCFQHDSCDGTDLWTRIRAYESRATALGENIAAGFPSPLETVNGWLLDGGAPDRSSGDGHRENIMSPKFKVVGHGSVAGGRLGVCDTQDFGNGAPPFATPLVSGSHVLTEGTITFLASFHARDGKAPGEAALELEGETVPLRVAYGTRANGTWQARLDRDGACRRYRFRFRDGQGRTWFHPEEGHLFTTGEGGCQREYEGMERTASR